MNFIMQVSFFFASEIKVKYALKLLQGLKNFPRQKEYVNVCHDTVRSLQDMSQKYGKCFDETTKKLNSACIRK